MVLEQLTMLCFSGPIKQLKTSPIMKRKGGNYENKISVVLRLPSINYIYVQLMRSSHNYLCKVLTENIPKTTMENPITKTRFNTFPTACVNGATRSRVLAASWKKVSSDVIEEIAKIMGIGSWKKV